MTVKKTIAAEHQTGKPTAAKKDGAETKGPKSAAEQQRLAEALKANLARRKNQQRGRKRGMS